MLLKCAKNYIIGSLASLAFPFYLIAIWISVIQSNPDSQLARVNEFLSFFPSILQDTFYLTVIAIFCCTIAFVCSLQVLKSDAKWLRITAYLIMGLASMLALWFLFTLM